MKEDYESECSKSGSLISQTQYADRIIDRISSFILKAEESGNFEIDESVANYDYTKISYKTINNCIDIDSVFDKINNIHLNTLRFIDLYAQSRDVPFSSLYIKSDFVDNLGAFTSAQYNVTHGDGVTEYGSLISDGGLFMAKVADLNVVAPRFVKTVVLNLLPVSSKKYCFVQMLCVPRDQSFFDQYHRINKAEWFTEIYRGIAVESRDGVNCHLTSTSLKIPAYVLLDEFDKQNHLNFLGRIFDFTFDFTNCSKYKFDKFEDIELELHLEKTLGPIL